MRHRSLATPFLTAFVVAGCPMKSAIWIVDGSTASHLGFGISDRKYGRQSIQWGGITVYDCYQHPGQDQHIYWGLERDPKSWGPNWPSRIVYGNAPSGFTNLRGPESLHPGCYEAGIAGTGHVAFVIDSAGAIRELPPTPLGTSPDTAR